MTPRKRANEHVLARGFCGSLKSELECKTTYGYIHDTLESDLMESATSTSGGENFDPTWDENGNMTVKDDTDDTEIEYNWDNKLRSAAKVIESTESSISVKYDPMGNRVWRQTLLNGSPTATRKYVVDISGGLPTILMEINPSNGDVLKTYVYANSQILMQHPGPANAQPPDTFRYYYLHDRLGSVREVIDKDAAVVRHYSYEPFGETIEETGTLTNPFMFTGQYYDTEIGQYYLRARQYDPQLMRFTTRDPFRGKYQVPMSLHKYLYCLNEPLNHIDPLGLTNLTEEEVTWGIEGEIGGAGDPTLLHSLRTAERLVSSINMMGRTMANMLKIFTLESVTYLSYKWNAVSQAVQTAGVKGFYYMSRFVSNYTALKDPLEQVQFMNALIGQDPSIATIRTEQLGWLAQEFVKEGAELWDDE